MPELHERSPMHGASYAPLLVDGVPVTYAGYTWEHGEQVCAEYASVSEAVGVWTVPLNEVTQ